MKFLANENFQFASAQYLLNHNFDITAVGTDYPGISDEKIIEIAIHENRTILTFNSDYGELIFKNNFQPSAGVIYIRVLPKTPESTGQLIREIVALDNLNFEQALTVIDSNGIRQRRY